jgi:hypothetical protein
LSLDPFFFWSCSSCFGVFFFSPDSKSKTGVLDLVPADQFLHILPILIEQLEAADVIRLVTSTHPSEEACFFFCVSPLCVLLGVKLNFFFFF